MRSRLRQILVHECNVKLLDNILRSKFLRFGREHNHSAEPDIVNFYLFAVFFFRCAQLIPVEIQMNYRVVKINRANDIIVMIRRNP